MPAAAVYFRDPDGHLIEYLAMFDGPASSGARDRSVVGLGSGRRARGGVRIEATPVPTERSCAGCSRRPRTLSSELDAYIDEGEVLVAVADERVVGHLQLIDNPATYAARDQEHGR